MRFTTEEQLVNRFAEQFSSARTDHWKWIREFSTAGGTADLVGVDLVTSSPNRESLAGIPSKWAYALYCLPGDNSFTVDDLAALANVSRSSARSVLRSFCGSGFCHRIALSDQWMKITEPKPVATKIVAVEAKLRDWRRALYQATQHATYASHSWVILDRMALNAVRFHVDEFAHRGVGLAGLSEDGEIEILVTAAENVPRMPTRFWQAHAEIARRLMHSLL
jgi:hypothetical protein